MVFTPWIMTSHIPCLRHFLTAVDDGDSDSTDSDDDDDATAVTDDVYNETTESLDVGD